MVLLARKCFKVAFPSAYSFRTIYGRCRIGTRDVVGYGINGGANYKDDAQFPFPAIRFKENTRDICALREKEKGDWRQLCCEEKKALYRASFCQTFAEFQHPTGQWKFIFGWWFVVFSFGFWCMIFCHYYVFEPLPSSFSKASQKAQLRRMLEIRTNPIDGISSKWDYDNDRWKRHGCDVFTAPVRVGGRGNGPRSSPSSNKPKRLLSTYNNQNRLLYAKHKSAH